MLREAQIERATLLLLLAKRGACAKARAEKRVSEIMLDGNDEAAQIWRRIADKITAIRIGPQQARHSQPEALTAQP